MFLVLQVKVPLILYLRLVALQVNSVKTTRKFLQIFYLLLHFSIEQLLSFIILGKKDGNMSSFKFFFYIYIYHIYSISWKNLLHFLVAG